jgi:hypothetical protein
VAGKNERGTHIGLHQLVVFISAGLDEWLVVPSLGIVEQDMQRSNAQLWVYQKFVGKVPR